MKADQLNEERQGNTMQQFICSPLTGIAQNLRVALPSAEVAQGHEDNVAHLLRPILEELGYDWADDVAYKPQFTHAILGQRREADLGILPYNESMFGMVVDLKAYGEPLKYEMVEKLAGYCGLAGALYGILTNGVDVVVIRLTRGVVRWEYQDAIPSKQRLQNELRGYQPPTSPTEQTYALRLTTGLSEEDVENFAQYCHNLIRSRRGLAVPERIYEFSKLLVARIVDERRFREGSQSQLLLTTETLQQLRERRVNIGEYIRDLLRDVNQQIGIFTPGETIDLQEEVIESIIRRLDTYPLWSESLDVLGHVYERFLMHTMTGQELGQYFTPRSIVRLMVEMVDPSLDQTIADPACGSGGFLIYALKHLKHKHNLSQQQVEHVASNLYGIDIFETVCKLSKINVWLNGDCHENIVQADSLDPTNCPDWWVRAIQDPREHGFSVILTNPPFGAREGTRYPAEHVGELREKWERQGINMFECAIGKRGQVRSVQPRSLFIEACIKALKIPERPGQGGRCAIVMDNGTLSNISREEPDVRRLIRRECIIEAVIGLPKGTFKAYGSNVIPSIMLLRRKFRGRWQGRDGYEEPQGPIFRAELFKIGFVPAMSRYRRDSDEDITTVLLAWQQWRQQSHS